jgi:uncharacterized protein
MEGTTESARSDGALAPVVGQERKGALDTLRGIALLGILLMNIVAMGLPFSYGDPTVSGGAEGLDLAAWIMNNLFFEGTMRGLFSLMFGAGVVLLTSRAEERGGGIEVADIYLRRNLWLFAFGIVHGWLLLWYGEILYFYGIAGLFLFAFRKLPPRTLIILGALVLVSLVPKNIYEYVTTNSAWDEAQAAQIVQENLAEGEELSEEQQGAIDAWKGIEEDANPSAEKIEERIEGMRGNYFTIIGTISGTLIWFQSSGLYQFMFFDTVGMMLIGMAFLKLGIITGERSNRFYLLLMLLGYGIGLGINVYETRLIVNNGFDIFAYQQANLTYGFGRVAVTFGHIGFWMLICKNGWLKWLTNRLAAVGRMALTNYVMHSVFAAFIFTGIGFSLFGALQRHELYYVVAGIWLFQLIVSPIWMKHFRFGPLEWVWRSLTYNEKQPMRRDATQG